MEHEHPNSNLTNTNSEKGEFETEIDKIGTANEKVETKIRKGEDPKQKKQKVDTHHSKVFKPHLAQM